MRTRTSSVKIGLRRKVIFWMTSHRETTLENHISQDSDRSHSVVQFVVDQYYIFVSIKLQSWGLLSLNHFGPGIRDQNGWKMD